MNTLHIYKKELRNYFNSTIAYVFFVLLLVIMGFFFYFSIAHYGIQSMLASRNPMMMRYLNPIDNILTPLFSLMGFLMIFFMPVLTMRLFSEEKKLGTMELLFTYPITEFQMVTGKFLASLTVVGIVYFFSFTYMIMFNQLFDLNMAKAPWGNMASGYLGLFLLSTAFMSFGMWVSSLTSDQVTSALGTTGGLLLFWVIGSARIDLNPGLTRLVEQLSLVEHFQDFTKGIIDTHHVVYLVCFSLFFIILTIQMLEVRKWRG